MGHSSETPTCHGPRHGHSLSQRPLVTPHRSPPWWPGILRPGGRPLGWGPAGTALRPLHCGPPGLPGDLALRSPCPPGLPWFLLHSRPAAPGGTHAFDPKTHLWTLWWWQHMAGAEPRDAPFRQMTLVSRSTSDPTLCSGGRNPHLPHVGRRLLPVSSLQTPLPRGAFLALSSV